MTFDGAVIREQGVTFAVVIVKRHVLDSPASSADAMRQFGTVFPGMPVVLMAQDPRGIPSYRGRRDLVRFLANVPLRAIPWRRYTLN
jgi:hypothetical protein